MTQPVPPLVQRMGELERRLARLEEAMRAAGVVVPPAPPAAVVETVPNAAAGVMASSGNTLLHVDEHADIGSPRLHQSLNGIGQDLRDVYRFTYDELSCFEFIVPALFQGMFKELVWVQQNAPERRHSCRHRSRPSGHWERSFHPLPSHNPQPPRSGPRGGRRARRQTPISRFS